MIIYESKDSLHHKQSSRQIGVIEEDPISKTKNKLIISKISLNNQYFLLFSGDWITNCIVFDVFPSLLECKQRLFITCLGGNGHSMYFC